MWKSMDVIGGLVSLAEGFAFVGALFGAAAVIRRLKTRQHTRHIMALMNEQLSGESSRPLSFLEDEYEDWIWIGRDCWREHLKQTYLRTWRILHIDGRCND